MAAKMSILILIAVIIFNCGNPTPQDDFRRELSEKIASLLQALEQYAPGEKQTDVYAISGNKGGETKFGMPSSITVVHRAKQIREHFERVSLDYILKHGNSIDSNLKLIKADMSELLESVRYHVARIENDFKKNPLDYHMPLWGYSLSHNEDGLYFVSGNEGIILEKYLSFSLDSWAERLKSKMKNMQQRRLRSKPDSTN